MHTHDDRVAERPPHLCAAYGCPLLGSSASSTTGTSEWWCSLHFGKDAGLMQQITGSMNRHRWLSDAITIIRVNARPKHNWTAHMSRVLHDLQGAGRDDLRWNGIESAPAWITRLETALMQLVASEVQPVVVTQAGLIDPDTWTKAQAQLPQWA
jgi:hypothetical protein